MFLWSNILLKKVVTFYLMIYIYKNHILFYEFLATLYMCDIFLWWHQWTEEGTGALGMGVTDSCESPDTGSGTKSRSSETAAVFLKHQD